MIAEHGPSCRLPPISRFEACLLGSALGDAIGEIAQHDLRGFGATPLEDLIAEEEVLRYTDDTAMTIALAESLVALGRVDEGHLGDRFRLAWNREPWRGYAGGPPMIFALVAKEGCGYLEAARRVSMAAFDGQGSCGNGAAMRAAPVGLLYHGQPALREEAEAQARVTHLHPAGVDGSVLQAKAVALALLGDPSSPLDTGIFLDALEEDAGTEIMRERLAAVRSLAAGKATDSEAASVLGRGETAQDSWPFALWSFLVHPDSFEACLNCAATNGGDADTVAAMACAISGARLGMEALPERWLSKLENRQRITLLGRLLHHRASGVDPRESAEFLPILEAWDKEEIELAAGVEGELEAADIDAGTGLAASPCPPARVAESNYFRLHVGWLKADPEPDWRKLRPVDVDALDDPEGAEDLVPALALEIDEARANMRAEMRTRGAWFHDNGTEVLGSRCLVLGETLGLVAFAEEIGPQVGMEALVPQFLVWLDLQRPGPSMLFFLRGADRIDVCLSGFTAARLRRMTLDHGGPAQGWREEGIGGMAAWCINRMYWDGLCGKAHWHCRGSLSPAQVFEALGGRVAAGSIVP
jgi:poly(ADP-ribose) glycohydrolase ARH3